jgi:hypothetical protein
MSDIATLQQQIDTLKSEIAELRSMIWAGGPRLGPQPESPEEVDARAKRAADVLIKAVRDEIPPADRSRLCTTNGRPVEEVRAGQTNETGQHAGYIVLCEEERQKGFVRPYRDRYQHVGPSGPKYPLRDLTTEEHKRYDRFAYVKFEAYPADAPEANGGSSTGRYWTQAQLDAVDKGCRAVTSMSRDLSETYARDPGFYGATFCVGCNRHLPVNEFVWSRDGERVGS